MKTISKGILAGIAAASFSGQDSEAASLDSLFQRAVHESSRYTSCPATQDEIACDTLASLYARDPEYRENCLVVSVRNKVRDRLRRDARLIPESNLNDSSGANALAVDAGSHEAEAEILELALVSEFRNSLGEEERAVLDLLESGMTEREIARSLRQSRHAIRCLRDKLMRRAARHFETQE